MKKAKWDVSRAKALFDEGADTKTIADAVDVDVQTIRVYAKRHSWRRADEPTQGESKAEHAAVPAVDPAKTAEPVAEAVPSGPIELTLRTGEMRIATLTAPDIDAALTLYRQLGACLAAMGVQTKKE